MTLREPQGSAPPASQSAGTTGVASTRLGETVVRRSARARAAESLVLASREAAQAIGGAGRAAAGWLSETVTPAGWMLGIVLVVGIVAGAAFGLAEAWIAAALAGVLLLASVPFLLGGASLRVGFRLSDDRVVAGSQVEAEITVENASRRLSLPVVLDVPVGPGLVEAFVPTLVGRATHVEQLRIAAPRRGIIRVGPMRITRGDPIGILHREFGWPQVEQVYVHPVTTRLPPTSAGLVKDVEGRPTRHIVDSDLAFHAIREYAPGDSRRHVHWKSTAKTGKLMVRQFEETRRARFAVLLDVRSDGYADEDEFELAVSAAASLALQAVRDGQDVLMVTSGRTTVRRGTELAISSLPTRSPKALLDATCAIALDERAEPLEAIAQLTATTFAGLSMAFVVTGSATPMERLRRAAFAFPTTASAAVVRAEPGAEPTLRSARDFSILTVGVLEDLKHLLVRGALG